MMINFDFGIFGIDSKFLLGIDSKVNLEELSEVSEDSPKTSQITLSLWRPCPAFREPLPERRAEFLKYPVCTKAQHLDNPKGAVSKADGRLASDLGKCSFALLSVQPLKPPLCYQLPWRLSGSSRSPLNSTECSEVHYGFFSS